MKHKLIKRNRPLSGGLRIESDQVWIGKHVLLLLTLRSYIYFPLFQYFPGNNDRHTVKTQAFSPPIKAVYFRVLPKGWHSYIAMRLELYGCPERKTKGFFIVLILFSICHQKRHKTSVSLTPKGRDTKRNRPDEKGQ